MGLWIGVLANVLGGSTYAVQKLALGHGWTPALLVLARMTLSLPFLVLGSPRGGLSSATRADKLRLVLIGTFGFAAPHLLGSYGLTEADSTSGAILIGMEPITILLFAALFLGERIGRFQLAGIGVALFGAALIVSNGDPRALLHVEGSTRGTLLLALHGAMWAIYTIAAKPTLARVGAGALTLWTTLIAMACLLPVGLLEHARFDATRALEPVPLAAVVGLGLGVSYLGTVLWNAALARIPATQMAALIFIQPLTGMILGGLLGEPIGPVTVLGAILVVGGVWLGERADRRAEAGSVSEPARS